MFKNFIAFTVVIFIAIYTSSLFAEATGGINCKKTVLDSFVASYEIRTPKKTTLMNYYRIGDSVAYEYTNQKMTEVWKKSVNGQAQLVRAFDAYNRSIEYDPIDVKMEHQSSSWDMHKNLATPELFHLDNALVSSKDGCAYQHYKKRISGKSIIMDFEANNQLLLSLEVKKDNEILYSYKLKNVKSIDKKQNHLVSVLSYDSTDFADIGDNESDPFLSRMITLGFITHKEANIIDDKGNALDLEK